MTPVRCSGCRRTVAYTRSPDPVRRAVYCDAWCASEPDLDPYEERHDLWRMLYLVRGLSTHQIATRFSVNHGQVYRLMARTARPQ